MKFSTPELIEKIAANRKKHRAVFEAALVGYRKAVIKALEHQLKRAKSGKKFSSVIRFTVPVEHTSDYDRILAMLRATTQAEVELAEHEFACYVLDEWEWKRDFITANSTYTSTR